MRIAFAGTPVFAERALAALLAAGHRIELVLTRPDRPAGRGQQLVASPVKRFAEHHRLAVFQPPTLRDPTAQARLREARPEAMVVAAYGLLLPPEVLAIPARGCLNIHASLLPRWRGAAPIQRAIEAGDRCTGITIMQMDEGLDTGPVLLEKALPIAADETAASVHDRLAELSAQAIVEALRLLEDDRLVPRPQPADGVTYARKIDKADMPIDWRLPARAVLDKVRALDPTPGATAALERLPEVQLKVWRARPATAGPVSGDAASVEPGTVVAVDDGAVTVACGDGEAVALLALQRPGGRRMDVATFLRGFPVRIGDRMRHAAGA